MFFTHQIITTRHYPPAARWVETGKNNQSFILIPCAKATVSRYFL